jgi:4-amino-4-deoxy-L-arabinose transferase-like glycosyltransferase
MDDMIRHPDGRPDGDALEADRPARRRGRVPVVVWWISALHISLLLLYSVLLPTFRAPDEQQHVDLSHVFSNDFQYPAWDERDTGSGVLNALDIVHFNTKSRHLEWSEAPHKDDRPSFDELDLEPRPRPINQLSQHPPLYYAVSGTLERAVELVTGDPIGAFDVEVWFYRLVSILMVAPVPLIVWTIGRRLGLPEPVTVAATLIPLAIPQYLHMGSAANNDSLMILLFWLLTPMVLRLAGGDVRSRVAGLAGLLTGLALYTKGFALILPLWVLAALVVALRRLGRQHVRRVSMAGVIYAAVALATGGWWWVANLVRYGELLPTRFDEVVAPIESDVRHYGTFLETWGLITTRRFWGDFGWFDVHIPGVAVAAATAVVLVGLVVACARRDRVGGSPVGDRLLLAAPILLLVAVQFANALRAYVELGRMPGLQGRYWFGALAALAALVTLGLANVFRGRVRWLPLGVFGGAIAMNVVAVSTILGFYWGGPRSGVATRVRAVVAWAPMQGEVLVAGAVVGTVVAVCTASALAMVSVRREGARPTAPTTLSSSDTRMAAGVTTP